MPACYYYRIEHVQWQYSLASVIMVGFVMDVLEVCVLSLEVVLELAGVL
jgi:hypothetical protein